MEDQARGALAGTLDRARQRLARLADPLHGDPDGEEGRRGRLFGRLMVAIWLVFLLEPASAAWAMLDTVRGWAGLVSVVAFAAAYLYHFSNSGMKAFAPHVEMPAAKRRMVVPGYLLVLALAVAATLLIGQEGTVTWVFLGVSGLWTWKIWQGLGVSLVLSGVYVGLEYQLPGWSSDNSLLFAMLLAMVAASGGVASARRGHALRGERIENARLMVQEERNRMARDLHDILGHSLTVITVKAELAGRLMDVDPERARAEMADLERLSRSALGDVRRAVEGYREISLSGELARAREALSSAGIEPDLPHALDEVPEDLQEVFAWTVREGVTNVIRHSGAERCIIEVDEHGIVISDDGHGRADMSMSGNGLRGLRERAIAAGAQVVTRGLQPHGFEVRVTVAQGPSEAVEPARKPVGHAGEALA